MAKSSFYLSVLARQCPDDLPCLSSYLHCTVCLFCATSVSLSAIFTESCMAVSPKRTDASGLTATGSRLAAWCLLRGHALTGIRRGVTISLFGYSGVDIGVHIESMVLHKKFNDRSQCVCLQYNVSRCCSHSEFRTNDELHIAFSNAI